MSHTKEPWEVYEGEQIHGVLDSEGKHLAEMWQRKNWDSLANARRIVACVNACAGWSEEELAVYAKDGIRTYSFETVKAVNARAETAEAEVKALRGLLIEAREWADEVANGYYGPDPYPDEVKTMREARATMEKIDKALEAKP